MKDRDRRYRSSWRVPAALLLSITVLAAACGSAKKTDTTSDTAPDAVAAAASANVVKTAAGPPHAGGKLVFGLDAETDGWNPTSSRWSVAGTTVANAVFDPLAAWDADFHTQPYLAQALDHNDAYDVWTIKLRPGVTFHDGEVVDAAAVKKDLDAVKASVLTSATFKPVSEIKVIDAQTVEVDMSIPWSAFPVNLTAQAGMVAAPKMLDDTTNGSRQPIGSGPFVFDKWTPDQVFSAKKNPSYWRKDDNGVQLPYLEAVDFIPIPEPQSGYDALRTGDVNVMATSNQQIAGKLKADADNGEIQFVQSAGETEESSVMLNTVKAPLDDNRVRTALAYATDQVAIAKISNTPTDQIATGPFVPGTHWAIDTGYPTFDAAKAKALIDQVRAEKGLVSVALQCTDNAEVVQVCQALAAMWGDAGVKVAISNMDQTKLINNALSGDYQATIWRQFGFPDPDGDQVWWNGANTKPPIALNMARNADEVLDNALNVGRTSADDFQRKLAYITVQRQLAKDVPYVWLSHIPWALGAQNSVRGIDSTTLPDGSAGAVFVGGVERLTQIWLEN